ncbi:TPA: hypothetical protein ACGOZH_001861 [Streptococcus suis]
MKKKKILNITINIIFIGMIFFAFFCAEKVSQKKGSSVVKEDFTILEKDAEISALFYDGQNVWVGTNEGVMVYNPDILEVIKTIDDLKLVYSAGITSSADGSIWIGHEKGLTQIDSAGQRTDYQYPDIAKGRVNTVLCDGEKIWCGTYNGAAVLELKQADKEHESWQVQQILDSSNGLCSNSVNIMIRVQNGILIGSYLDTISGGLTFLKEDGEIQTIGTEQGLPHPYVTSLLELPSGDVLVGTGYMEDGGLAVLSYESGEYKVVDTLGVEDGMPGDKIRSLFYSNQTIWITTEYDGILMISEQDFRNKAFENGRYLRQENGLSDNEIKCIVESDKYSWLGGKYGLTLIPKE